MCDAADPGAPTPTDWKGEAMQRRLRRRYRSEWRFRLLGLSAVVGSAVFLAVLLVAILGNGLGGFIQPRIALPIDLPRLGIVIDPARLRGPGANLALAAANLDGATDTSATTAFGTGGDDLLSDTAWLTVRDAIKADPSLLTRRVTIAVPASDAIDSAAEGYGSAAPAAIVAAGRRADAGADDHAGDRHRRAQRDQGGAALDPRGRARHRRLAGAGGVPPRPAAGFARHPDRHDHRHGARAGRDRTAADDRHARLHRRAAQGVHRSGQRAAGADLPVVRPDRPRRRREDQRRDRRAAALPVRDERRRDLPPQPFRDPLVMTDQAKITARNVSVYYGANRAIDDVSSDIDRDNVTAFIGPSGCGKSTFLRALNRMNATVANARVTGEIRLDGEDIYAPAMDVVQLRARVGMVFQKPNPIPKSFYENVV